MNAIRDNSQSNEGRHGDRRGFTLIEVLLSIGILGVGMAMIAAIFPVAANEAQVASNTVLGNLICNNSLAIAKGILSGGQRDIGSVTAVAATPTWTDPVSSTVYQTTVLTLSSNWAATDQFVGGFLEIYSGTGAVQSLRILSNGASGLTLSPATPLTSQSVVVAGLFSPALAPGSLYRITQPRAAADSGTATYPTFPPKNLNVLSDNTKCWSANQWAYWYCFFPAGYSGLTTPTLDPIIPMTRSNMASANLPIAHSEESIKIELHNTATLINNGVTSLVRYQLVLLADENTCTNPLTSPIYANTLHFPTGYNSSVANGTSRGCVLFTTKPLITDTNVQPANMSSADSAVIVAVAYNKSSRSNLVAWGGVMVTSMAYTYVASLNATVPVVTITSGTLCTGSPLVLMETGQVANITQVLTTTTAVLDNVLPMPRGAATAMALVVQEIPFVAGNPANGPFTGTPLPNSPAIAWKVSQTGSR